MRKLQLFICLVILTLGCVEEEGKVLNFNPNDKTSIKFKFTNCNEPKGYTFIYWQTLPFDQIKSFINFSSDTIIELDISLNHPLHINLYDTKEAINFFVIPNDTLTISIDLQEKGSLKESVQYDGTTGQISEYLTRVRKHWYGSPSEKQSPESYNKKMDSFYSDELTKLDSVYKEKFLPKWFVEIEKVNISHERDNNKFDQFNQRVMFYDQFIPTGIKFKNSIDLSKMDYYWLFNTNYLLANFKADTFDILLQQKNWTPEIGKQYSKDNINTVKERISETALSYFVASRLSGLFVKRNLLSLTPTEFNTRVKDIDEFIENYSHLISDTSIYNFIMEEKERVLDEYQGRSFLVKGDTASNFFLSDIDGNLVKLTDFKNKVVLLNFWGTYCSPCIKSIPDKNKLVKEFSSEEFELVNIIIDSNLDRWKEILQENNFQGTHLVCKGNWNEILRSKYNIKSIPHYTLIDKKGIVINNNIKDSLEYHIRKSL